MFFFSRIHASNAKNLQSQIFNMRRRIACAVDGRWRAPPTLRSEGDGSFRWLFKLTSQLSFNRNCIGESYLSKVWAGNWGERQSCDGQWMGGAEPLMQPETARLMAFWSSLGGAENFCLIYCVVSGLKTKGKKGFDMDEVELKGSAGTYFGSSSRVWWLIRCNEQIFESRINETSWKSSTLGESNQNFSSEGQI